MRGWLLCLEPAGTIETQGFYPQVVRSLTRPDSQMARGTPCSSTLLRAQALLDYNDHDYNDHDHDYHDHDYHGHGCLHDSGGQYNDGGAAGPSTGQLSRDLLGTTAIIASNKSPSLSLALSGCLSPCRISLCLSLSLSLRRPAYMYTSIHTHILCMYIYIYSYMIYVHTLYT